MEDIYELFRVLADKRRLEILEFLLNDDYCVNELNVLVGSTQPNISQHLKVLRDAGIIIVSKKGRTSCYVVRNKPRIIKIIHYARKVVIQEEEGEE